jgi:hypothetical protein
MSFRAPLHGASPGARRQDDAGFEKYLDTM